jgi:hypothetical protein
MCQPLKRVTFNVANKDVYAGIGGSHGGQDIDVVFWVVTACGLTGGNQRL